ncbi:MAG: M23 family metallopeptidase [Sphingomonas fennica]
MAFSSRWRNATRAIAANPSQKERYASGNYVSLNVGPRRFAIYEHLRPGSVRVRPGQRVKSGDIIGALGFTGDSTGPHLHLPVAECATPFACEGVPFTIRRMIVNGRYADVGDMGLRPWGTVTGRQRPGAFWPGYNVVVSFPGTR